MYKLWYYGIRAPSRSILRALIIAVSKLCDHPFEDHEGIFRFLAGSGIFHAIVDAALLLEEGVISAWTVLAQHLAGGVGTFLMWSFYSSRIQVCFSCSVSQPLQPPWPFLWPCAASWVRLWWFPRCVSIQSTNRVLQTGIVSLSSFLDLQDDCLHDIMSKKKNSCVIQPTSNQPQEKAFSWSLGTRKTVLGEKSQRPHRSTVRKSTIPKSYEKKRIQFGTVRIPHRRGNYNFASVFENLKQKSHRSWQSMLDDRRCFWASKNGSICTRTMVALTSSSKWGHCFLCSWSFFNNLIRLWQSTMGTGGCQRKDWVGSWGDVDALDR